jgi:hypothetical protein
MACVTSGCTVKCTGGKCSNNEIRRHDQRYVAKGARIANVVFDTRSKKVSEVNYNSMGVAIKMFRGKHAAPVTGHGARRFRIYGEYDHNYGRDWSI